MTVIDGSHTGSTVTCTGVGASTIIEGFTITGGDVSSLTTLGGGVRLNGSDATVRNNLITGNTAVAGGGMYVDGGGPTISGNTISHNNAPFGSGGGIYFDHSAHGSTLQDVIIDNSCAAYGGGVTVWESSNPQITECTIVGNQAVKGAGFFVRGSTFPTLGRTIIAFNGGSGVELDLVNTLAIGCCDVFGNSGGNYLGMSDPSGGNGNQSADPVFCNLATRDLTISGFSPCSPAHSPGGCDLVGALQVACSATPTLRTSWARLKTRYR